MARGRSAAVVLGTVIAAAIALAVALPGDDGQPGGVRNQDRHRAGASYRDPRWRFGVEIPAGWRRAREIVIRQVTNPREILVASTYPLQSSRDCGPFYDHLLGHLGPREALVAVQERFGHAVAWPPEFPLRPKRFRLAMRRPERRGCGRDHVRRLVRDWWIPFRDADRTFYAQVTIGLAAPDKVRRDAERLLDSLHFE